MNISGIVLQARPGQLEDALAEVATLPGVEVHHREAEAGRAVVTIEAADTEAEMAMLRSIQDLPPVAMAELVYHYFEEETAQAATQRSAEVPGRLRR